MLFSKKLVVDNLESLSLILMQRDSEFSLLDIKLSYLKKVASCFGYEMMSHFRHPEIFMEFNESFKLFYDCVYETYHGGNLFTEENKLFKSEREDIQLIPSSEFEKVSTAIQERLNDVFAQSILDSDAFEMLLSSIYIKRKQTLVSASTEKLPGHVLITVDFEDPYWEYELILDISHEYVHQFFGLELSVRTLFDDEVRLKSEKYLAKGALSSRTIPFCVCFESAFVSLQNLEIMEHFKKHDEPYWQSMQEVNIKRLQLTHNSMKETLNKKADILSERGWYWFNQLEEEIKAKNYFPLAILAGCA